jgi:hypothetical protein
VTIDKNIGLESSEHFYLNMEKTFYMTDVAVSYHVRVQIH